MKKIIVLIIGVAFSLSAIAITCPDPHSSDLQWGKLPVPWELSPFSATSPQADVNTKFIKANILVAGIGQGVSCTYQNSVGRYSIWWQVRSKIPSRMESYWVATIGGYVCSAGIEACPFQVAIE